MLKQRQNAGGAAVNAGAEYQHRIGAFISALMIARGELSLLVGSDQKLGTPMSLRYETLDAVDDINVVTDQGSKVYIQAKRRITKPILRDVLRQFAQQYRMETPDQKSIYSLVTSSRSSATISYHAKTVLEVLRAAPSEDFSPSHNEHLQIIYNFLVEAAAMALKNVGISNEDEDIRNFLQFVHIDVCDIEKNELMEKSALLLLTSYASNEAWFLWNKLLSDNAQAASNRMTLEKTALEVRYRDLLHTGSQGSKWFFKIDLEVKEIPVGMEYVLLEILDSDGVNSYLDLDKSSIGDVVFWGTERFDKNCRKNLKFSADQCILPNGKALKLMARAASTAALNRIMRSQKLIDFEKMKTYGHKLIINIKRIDPNPQNKSACARKYRPRLLEAFHKNANPSRCLVCARPVIEQGALTVEIDEEESEFEVGIVHAECYKPAHRVIGTLGGNFLDMFPQLRRFDADAYIRSLPYGQGAFASLPAEIPETVFVIAWSGEGYNPDGAFCLQIELINGNHTLVFHRGRVERLEKPVAEQKAKQMNEIIQWQAEHNDPMCIKIIEDGYCYGPKSGIKGTNNEPGEMVIAKFVKVVRFEERAAKALDKYRNWYAPLCYFRVIDDQRILTINNSVVLLTNPFSIASLAAGLKPIGIDLQEFETRVIASDIDFDGFAREIFESGRNFVVDPILDKEGNLKKKAKIALAPWMRDE